MTISPEQEQKDAEYRRLNLRLTSRFDSAILALRIFPAPGLSILPPSGSPERKTRR